MSNRGWEKVLWKSQPYPDNYINPDSFLSSLRKNPNFLPLTYWPLVHAACAITQHLATIFIFLAVFVRLKERLLDPRLLVWLSIVCFIIGYLAWEDHTRIDRKIRRTQHVKASVLMFVMLMSLSPVLKTLSAATSSDSIWALSAFLFTVNALLADYTSSESARKVRIRLSSVLSMNAGISSSVVLASRLADDLSVFALTLFSVQLFALFPMLGHRLQTPFMTFSLSALALFFTAPLSSRVAGVFATTLVFVTFVAPAVLVWAQKYKNEIRGSWDVAVPKINQPDRVNARSSVP